MRVQGWWRQAGALTQGTLRRPLLLQLGRQQGPAQDSTEIQRRVGDRQKQSNNEPRNEYHEGRLHNVCPQKCALRPK